MRLGENSADKLGVNIVVRDSTKRPLPDSNRGWRICNPLPYHLAKGPIGPEIPAVFPPATERRYDSGIVRGWKADFSPAGGRVRTPGSSAVSAPGPGRRSGPCTPGGRRRTPSG